MDRGTGGPTMWSDEQLIEVIHGSPAAVDDALRAIQAGDPAWEKMVPEPAARVIKQRKLFGLK